MEEVVAVVRTGGSFGVALDREDWQLLVVQALDAVVIEIAAGDFQAIGQRVGGDAPAVVLGGDEK